MNAAEVRALCPELELPEDAVVDKTGHDPRWPDLVETTMPPHGHALLRAHMARHADCPWHAYLR